MNISKLFFIVAITLFGLIGFIGLAKKISSRSDEPKPVAIQQPIEITIAEQEAPASIAPAPLTTPPEKKEKKEIKQTKEKPALPDADRIEELFNKAPPQLPIVETITYKSHVNWLKGRPAWLTDYAAHYSTSRHFIARSLTGKPDYSAQDLKEGAKFNVFKQGKNFEFYLLVDASSCRMWFYYLDLDLKQKTLIKTYSVCLGRVDASKASGLLTPLGKYSLGNRVATYKPKVMGLHRGKKVEMVTVFGTRWIPFEQEIGTCTAPAKGFGLHGTPCTVLQNGELQNDSSSIGKYESDGCIRLSQGDIEEVYSIIITKPTTIEIARDFFESSLSQTYPESG